MLLLIKSTDDDGRFEPVRRFLTTPWTVIVADPGNHEAFASALENADAVLSMNWSAAFPRAPKLRLLQLPGAGTDDIDFNAVPPTASVCNAYEHEIGIAEYTLAAMLEWQIGVQRMNAQMREGRWSGSYLGGPAQTHRELFGATLGIVGYGRIGREVAKRAHAFGSSPQAERRDRAMPGARV
jgi:phosphoglycerate dehydrogenase-like enzyme